MTTAQEFLDALYAQGVNVHVALTDFATDSAALQQLRAWWRDQDPMSKAALEQIRGGDAELLIKELATMLGGGAGVLEPLKLLEIDDYLEMVGNALGAEGNPPTFVPNPATMDPPEPDAHQGFAVHWTVENVGGASQAYKDHVEIRDNEGKLAFEVDVDQAALAAGGNRASQTAVEGLDAGTYRVEVWVNWTGSTNPDQPPAPNTPATGYQVSVGANAPLVVGGLAQYPSAGMTDFQLRVNAATSALSGVTGATEPAAVAAEAEKVATAATAVARAVPDDHAGRLTTAAGALAGFTVSTEKAPAAAELLDMAPAAINMLNTALNVVSLTFTRSASQGRDEDYDRANPPPAVLEAAEAVAHIAEGLVALKSADNEAPAAPADGGDTPPSPPADTGEEPSAAPHPMPEEQPEPSEEVKAWGDAAATSLVYPLVALSDEGAWRSSIEWFREDLSSELARKAGDAQEAAAFQAQVQTRVQALVPELGTEARRSLFQQLLAHTGQGGVWLWVRDWGGFRPQDIEGEEQRLRGEAPSPADYMEQGGRGASDSGVYVDHDGSGDSGVYVDENQAPVQSVYSDPVLAPAQPAAPQVTSVYILNEQGEPVTRETVASAAYAVGAQGEVITLHAQATEDGEPEVTTEDGTAAPTATDDQGYVYITSLPQTHPAQAPQ